MNSMYSNKDFLLKNADGNVYIGRLLYKSGLITATDFKNTFSEDPNTVPSLDQLYIHYTPNSLEYYLKYDMIDGYKSYMDQAQIRFNSVISVSDNYPFLYVENNKTVSHNQFSAFYGSLKCYKFARMNGSNKADLKYALTCGNQYLLNLAVPKEPLNVSDLFTTAVKFHRPNAFGYLMAVYNLDPKGACKLDETIKFFNEQFFFVYAEYAIEDINAHKAINLTGSMLSAANNDSIETLRFLLSNNLDSQSLNQPKNPLHIACSNGNFEIAKLLISKKVDVNVKSSVSFFFSFFHISV